MMIYARCCLVNAAIEAEAIEMARYVDALRIRDPKGSGGALGNPSRIPRRAEPVHDGSAEVNYHAGLRFWAQRAATQLTLDDWHEMIEIVRAAVPDFHGDVIRFFETLFSGLRLSDGNL